MDDRSLDSRRRTGSSARVLAACIVIAIALVACAHNTLQAPQSFDDHSDGQAAPRALESDDRLMRIAGVLRRSHSPFYSSNERARRGVYHLHWGVTYSSFDEAQSIVPSAPLPHTMEGAPCPLSTEPIPRFCLPTSPPRPPPPAAECTPRTPNDDDCPPWRQPRPISPPTLTNESDSVLPASFFACTGNYNVGVAGVGSFIIFAGSYRSDSKTGVLVAQYFDRTGFPLTEPALQALPGTGPLTITSYKGTLLRVQPAVGAAFIYHVPHAPALLHASMLAVKRAAASRAR